MSVRVMSWAFGLDLKPSSLKFVLVCLADHCGDEGVMWPSIAAVCQKTSLDRKTVINAIGELERIGFLLDTGERVGKTNQVKVYRLVGYDSGTRHYTYRISDPVTNEFYVGVRTCSGDPSRDGSYMGSGTWPLAAIRQKRELIKTVIAEFKTREDACAAEAILVAESLPNPLCRNKSTARGTVPIWVKEQYRFSDQTVPETGHGTIIEPSRNRKGTRLPSDWELTEERKQEATKNGKDPLTELAIFRDYWAAQPGRHGVKLDWDATWRNWCRRSFGKPAPKENAQWSMVRAALRDSDIRKTLDAEIVRKVGLLGGFIYLGSLKPFDLEQKRKEFESIPAP